MVRNSDPEEQTACWLYIKFCLDSNYMNEK